MLLEVSDLRTHFATEDGLIRAVDGVSFTIDEGQTLCIVGESGCGKTVTALTLMGLLPIPPARVVGGDICFRGKNLLKLAPHEMRDLRGNEMAMIFQEPMTSLNPVYTVGFQIAEAIQIHRPAFSQSTIKKRVLDLLMKVGMSEPQLRYNDYPHQMSGGMRQRVMIAMALACEPKLLIADEPTTALDVTIQAQILELITKLQKEMGMAVILITHDLGIVAEMADDVMVMYAGSVVEFTSAKRLFASPLHPYTRGLLESIPSLQRLEERGSDGKKVRRLKTIGGVVPNLAKLPNGCRFQDRCSLVKEHCRFHEPPLEEKAKLHKVSCFEVKVESSH